MSTIFKSSRMARFLATLFALVMIFGLCAAVPTSNSDLEDIELDARGNSASSLQGVTLVRMGNTGYFDFKRKGDKYGSTGFNACLGVLIVGDGGAIIGHYAANNADVHDEWEINEQAAINAIPTYFSQHKNAFKTGLKTYIYAQIESNGHYTFPDLVASLSNIIKKATGKTPSVKTYKSSTGKKGSGGGFVVEVKSQGYSVSWA